MISKKQGVIFQGEWREATMADANGLVSGHAYTVTKVMRVCTTYLQETY